MSEPTNTPAAAPAFYESLAPLPEPVQKALIEVVQLALVVEEDLSLMLSGAEVTRETLYADRDGLRVALAKFEEVRRG